MFRLMRCEDGTARGSMGIILFTAEHILEFRVSGCSRRVEIETHVSPMSLRPRLIYSIGTFASSGSTAAIASAVGFLNWGLVKVLGSWTGLGALNCWAMGEPGPNGTLIGCEATWNILK